MSKAKISKRIEAIRVRRMIDTDPDTSWLGEFSDSADSDYAIIHVGPRAGTFRVDLSDDEELPERGREYRYFNPNDGNYKGEPDEDIRKYCLQDYKRMCALNNGRWCFIGIKAEAEIAIGGHIQRITSGGLWGIESDSNESYLIEVGKEEVADLRDQLYALTFSKRAIATACKEIKLVND